MHRHPLIKELSLYDIVGTEGVGADLSHIDTDAVVRLIFRAYGQYVPELVVTSQSLKRSRTLKLSLHSLCYLHQHAEFPDQRIVLDSALTSR